jgi:hypothetical protein
MYSHAASTSWPTLSRLCRFVVRLHYFGFTDPSAEYPNTTEGLQNLMNDILSATRRGDSEKVVELIKQPNLRIMATIL